MVFRDSDDVVTKVDVSKSTSSRAKSATKNDKMTEDASTEGIIGSITELDAKIVELKNKLNSLKSSLSGLKSSAAKLAGATCDIAIFGDCEASVNCNVDSLIAAYGPVHANAIEIEIQCIETNLEVLECTRALYAFMKPNNMRFS